MIKLTRKGLTRSNLRNVVLLLSFVSAIFFTGSPWSMAVGSGVFIVGCFLHIITKGILVRNVVLCERGVYGIVRHPYYLANYMIDTGLCILSGNLYLPVVYPFLFFWAYGPTMRKEETYLSSTHSEAFMHHSSAVPQVFLDPASLKGLRSFFEGFSMRRISWKELSRVTRFGSLGLLIVLVHEIKFEGFSSLLDVIHPNPRDIDEFAYAFLALLLYAASHIFMRVSRHEGDFHR